MQFSLCWWLYTSKLQISASLKYNISLTSSVEYRCLTILRLLTILSLFLDLQIYRSLRAVSLQCLSRPLSPLTKKPGLDQSDPSNYRPISNLNNISKLLERLFLFRFQSHVSNSPNFNPLQSAYRRFHSTETSLLNTLDQDSEGQS